jgi:glycosyltransferase involved in cell wall biosynthesis
VSVAFDVVVPTVGRPSLAPLVGTLRRHLPAGVAIIVADDRTASGGGAPLPLGRGVRVVRTPDGGGRGPAAARNAGWRAGTAPWVVFLDDDVELPLGWVGRLEEDLRRAGADVAAVQGRIHVPLPADRRPTDWERNVAGLDGARWITADMAVRRPALVEIGGFDERFPRAYREDTDLALRLLDRGWSIAEGQRVTHHPVRPAPWWISVRLQRGNADDVLLERLHGARWRDRLGIAPGSFAAHRTTVLAALGAAAAAVTRHPRLALALAALWTCRTARFTWSRIAPGPRTLPEVAAMVGTTPAIPPAAVYHHVRARLARLRHLTLLPSRTEVSV